MDRQCERLKELLGSLAPDEVAQFATQFDQRMAEAYRWDLWGAAYLIAGGCSDDGFIDFRSWLISMGRETYEAALRDPESLAGVATSPGGEETEFEEFQYVAADVYERKTGRPLPDSDRGHPQRPSGTEWSEDGDDLARRFPKLWKQFSS